MSILAPIILAPIAYPASFDCTKAKSRVEKLICADAELSRLGEEMKAAYQQANQNTADPVGLRAEQKQWLGLRDICKDAGCVNQIYRSRLASLYSMIQASKPCFRLLERKWPEVASGHYPVCVDLLKSMNTYCSYLPLCEWKVDPFITSLSVPQWEELDPREHLKLIQHLYQGQSDFQAPEEQWKPIPPDTLRNIHEGKTRLWRAWIDVDRDGQKEYVVRFHANRCENNGIDFYGTESRINVTDAAMTRVDPRYASWSTAAMDIVLHDNRVFVVIRGDGNGFDVGEPFSTRQGKGKGKRPVCVFEYLKQ